MWYTSWFDSPYYHILYKDRDYKEAERFIDNLLKSLKPQKGSKILDIGCGRGRHSVYLHKKGFEVTGIDLSPGNIAYAKQFEDVTLSFFVHDMRKQFRTEYFDLAVNLFTSFGYFENDIDNEHTVSCAAKAIKESGLFLIDFMNSKKVIDTLVKEEIKEVDKITFRINRKVESGFIIKTIEFNDKGQSYSFEEKVKVLYPKDFERYFRASGLKLINLFGDYDLNDFDENKSDRLIMLCKK